jgi:signal transduction histidine kinase
MRSMQSLVPPTASRSNPRQLVWTTVLTGIVLLAAGAWTQSRLGDRLLPHSFCIRASEPLLILHFLGDGLIAFAYLLIPWAILNFVRRRADIPFGWIAWVFGAFIVACGVTHAIQVWTLWYPVYWYAGVAKAFTAAVSLGTAWLLYRLTPVALALPSADDLRRANDALQREILERKKTERALAEAHSRLEAVLQDVQVSARRTRAVLDRFFDEAPLGLALVSAEGRVLRVNASLLAQSRRQLSEYVGQDVRRLAGVDGDLVAAIEKVRDGAPRQIVTTVRGSGAQETVLRCTMFGIPVENHERLVGAVVQDVTAEEHLAIERARAIESLREADRRKDDFIAMLAHELRNPLSAIATAAHVLRRSEDPGMDRMVEIVRRQMAHMGRLLDDLLDVSRIVRGKLDVRREGADLNAIACAVAEDLRATIERSGTALIVQIHPNAIPVHADPVRIAQAVGNYLHNAGKFARGGRVLLRTFVAGNEAVVRVEDNGRGIDPSLIQTIFQPFAQGEQDLSRQDGGLGLGLALAKGIAELHGGHVRGESSGPGHGAAFEIRLPLHGSGLS